MKTISIWASRHVMITRYLVAFIKLLLAAMAYYTGMALYHMQVIVPGNALLISSLLVFLAIAFIYPNRKKIVHSTRWHYAKQKTCDIIIGLCSFVSIAATVNNGDIVNTYSHTYGSGIIKHPVTVTELLQAFNSGEKTSFTPKEKRILKREFYRQLKIYAVATVNHNAKQSGEAWKIILVIIAALGLLYLLAGLVCSLSCGGADFAAIIVGVLGGFGIILGSIALIRRITLGPKKLRKEKEE